MPVLEHGQFTSLGVDLQEVEVLNLGDVVKPAGFKWDTLNYLG